MNDPNLPGVTLFHKGERRYQVGTTQKVELKLEGTIVDENIWKAVGDMFIRGFRVYTQEDFKESMMNVFRTEVIQLEKRVSELESENRRLDYENQLLRQELEEKRKVFDDFSRSFRH